MEQLQELFFLTVFVLFSGFAFEFLKLHVPLLYGIYTLSFSPVCPLVLRRLNYSVRIRISHLRSPLFSSCN